MTFGVGRPTRMPCLPLELNELDAEKVLVDLEDSRHDLGYGEVLLHERVVELQGLFDELAVVVPVVPKVEFAVGRQAFLLVLLIFERK